MKIDDAIKFVELLLLEKRNEIKNNKTDLQIEGLEDIREHLEVYRLIRQLFRRKDK